MNRPRYTATALSKGIFTHAYQPRGRTSVIPPANGGATIVDPEIAREQQTASVKAHLILSANAVAFSAYSGTPNEYETLGPFARVGARCRRW